MSLSIIPAIFFVTLMVLSSFDKLAEEPKKPLWSTKKTMKKPVGMVERKKSDQDTIFSYITSKYKKVSVEDAKKIAKNLVDYGKKYNLDPKFAAAVIARESGFKKDAVSVTGAKGLGQIKDFNYKDLKIKDPFNINQNVDGTIQYLKKMIKKWNENEDSIVVEKAGGNKEVANKRISESALKDVLTECENINNSEPITLFEITTCAAFLAFSREPADYTLLA